MFYCAYELNLPNMDELREELRNYAPDQEATWQASEYLDHRLVGPETIKFYELFDDCFLINMRFLKAPPGTYYQPHIDIDANEMDHFQGEIPPYMPRHATVNILLGEPDPVMTQWWVDLEARKIDWKRHRQDSSEKKYKLVDEFSLGTAPLLFNTGLWHSVQYTKERWMAGFHFHPLVPWEGAVEYCREKGFLVER